MQQQQLHLLVLIEFHFCHTAISHFNYNSIWFNLIYDFWRVCRMRYAEYEVIDSSGNRSIVDPITESFAIAKIELMHVIACVQLKHVRFMLYRSLSLSQSHSVHPLPNRFYMAKDLTPDGNDSERKSEFTSLRQIICVARAIAHLCVDVYEYMPTYVLRQTGSALTRYFRTRFHIDWVHALFYSSIGRALPTCHQKDSRFSKM